MTAQVLRETPEAQRVGKHWIVHCPCVAEVLVDVGSQQQFATATDEDGIEGCAAVPQATLNVVLGERYKVIPEEVRRYVRGYDGRPPAPIDPQVKRLAIGDEEGAPVCVLEAMKMENELHARQGGTVRAVHVKPGDDVEEDQVLVEIE